MREGAAVRQGAGVMRHGEAPMGACRPRGRRTPGVSARGALVWLATSCHADTYDITPTTQITPRPDPPERTLGSRDQTHVEPPVRKRHMRTTRGFPLLDATPQECS